MPTIIYPTQPPQYPTVTPVPNPNQGGLQIYPNVGQGVTVHVGQIIKVCYKVPQYGKFTFTTITDTWQTNKSYIDDGTGDCLVRQIVNPIGKHTYRITMNGASAETYVVVSGQFEPGYHPYDQVIPLETVQ